MALYEKQTDQNIHQHVNTVFEELKTARKPFEEEAEEWWFNFISQYNPKTTWRTKEGEDNRSRIFIKMTQLKCYTAHAKIMDAIGPEIPFSMEALKTLDYSQIPPDAMDKIVEFRRKYINDYLKSTRFLDVLDNAVLSSTIFHFGVIKGPIIKRKKEMRHTRRMVGGIPVEQIDPSIPPYESNMQEVEKYACDEVPWWDYYVDPYVKHNSLSYAEVHFKRLLPAEFRAMADEGGFDEARFKECLKNIDELKEVGEGSDTDHTYRMLGDNYTGKQANKDGRIPVVEYWGFIKAKHIREFGSDVPAGIDGEADVEAIIVVAGYGNVIKCQYNFLGKRPFHLINWKKKPNCLYGNSPAGLMADSQSMINSGCRMLVDNKALSGNGCLVVNRDRIDFLKTKDLKVYPRKTFFTKGNFAPREVIDSLTFPDVTLGLQQMVEMFMRFSDEETAIPKYTHGESDGFLNKTATGISMLLGQTNLNLKPVLKNIDDNVLEPLIEAYDSLFSMFEYPPEVNIPLKIYATGTVSLIAKEIIVEQMMRLLQITAGNPEDAMLVDRRKMLREIANKLGYADFVRTDEQIQQIEQMLAQQMQGQQMEIKGRVDIDRLYPLLARTEQIQILERAGIQPDPNYVPPANPQAAQSASQARQPYARSPYEPGPDGIVPDTSGT